MIIDHSKLAYFSNQYWLTLVIGFSCISLCLLAFNFYRDFFGTHTIIMRRLLASLGVTTGIIGTTHLIFIEHWTILQALPLELCSFTCTVLFPLALMKAWKTLMEVCILFSLLGAPLAYLFPDITPSINLLYINFYLYHALMIIMSGYVLIIERLSLTRFTWIKASIALNLYIAVMMPYDLIFHQNLFFLMQRPIGTPEDYFGPWPMYIVVSDLLFILVFIGINHLLMGLKNVMTHPSKNSQTLTQST